MEAVRRVASSQGRSEREILDDAVRGYIVAVEGGDKSGNPRSVKEARALLARMSSRLGDLDEDEAMEIALREQRAFRRERAGEKP